jgi:cytoskeletal protein RodZ
MSSQDVDKLFRDALDQGQATPRPEAWARVAKGLPKAQPKRRALWWPYAAAASVAIAAVSTWWIQDLRPEAASSQQPATSNQQQVASNQQPAASNQQPAASNQQPAASNQQPAASSQQPAASNQKRMDRFDLAFLPRMEAESFEELVPLLDRQVVVAVQAPSPEVPRPRYLQLAANVQNVWSAVRQYREAEVPANVSVEVHLPAPVLRRINQTKMLASNLNQSLNQSWSTLYSRRSR